MTKQNRGEARREILSFLSRSTTPMRRAVRKLFRNISDTIDLKVVRNISDNGQDPSWERDVFSEVDKFLTTDIRDILLGALERGGEGTQRSLGKSVKQFNSLAERMRAVIQSRRSILEKSLGTQTVEDVVFQLKRLITVEGLGERGVAERLKRIIGLNRNQQTTIINLAASLRDAGEAETTISSAVSSRSGIMLEQRSRFIARNEMVFAFNAGKIEGVRQLQEEGELSQTVKEWVTAGDERVECICEPLDGQRAELNEPFEETGCPADFAPLDNPPAHFGCRCTVVFDEQV